ncbi:hypothetical protein QFZ64_000196 [Streptomyces sp. B3I8]|nr:hypothetical protein [Streptomyces sp. B3I8]
MDPPARPVGRVQQAANPARGAVRVSGTRRWELAGHSQRTVIVTASVDRFHAKGYHATGVNDIAVAAGGPQRLLPQPLREQGGAGGHRAAAVRPDAPAGGAERSGVAPLGRLPRYFEFLRDEQVEHHITRGCLSGGFGSEMADHSKVPRGGVEHCLGAMAGGADRGPCRSGAQRSGACGARSRVGRSLHPVCLGGRSRRRAVWSPRTRRSARSSAWSSAVCSSPARTTLRSEPSRAGPWVPLYGRSRRPVRESTSATAAGPASVPEARLLRGAPAGAVGAKIRGVTALAYVVPDTAVVS